MSNKRCLKQDCLECVKHNLLTSLRLKTIRGFSIQAVLSLSTGLLRSRSGRSHAMLPVPTWGLG